ncbi:FtsK/SpoIIIE domain-containing protein [Brevibacillus choshinensis]|uniref:FtsK/SpoIIIE domain-containing protein n=1 Tax=Brevibacillus choshinensis TaxID=54911 RepID=UPI002E1C39C8|nr:FtsK/SpoIIIE domain-containing protein [Brevibacillus choshinensis]MED4783425.1 FtsK/SpoIIIE domain-containing protein [Brevibacillus choshinensis]
MFELSWYFGALLGKTAIASGMVYVCGRAAPYLISPNRQRMQRAFRLADICIKRKKYGLVNGGKPYESTTYPTIEHVSKTTDKLAISFRLPVGFNPAELERKEYVFRQIFGPSAFLHRSDDRFYQLIVTKPVPTTIPYNFPLIEEAFHKTGGLPVFAGIDQSGSLVCYDMRTKPHLGIVGVTGYGKSSMLRVLLCSWLQYFRSDQMHLYLGDLKKTEFQQYDGVPHVRQVAVRRTEVTRMLQGVCRLLDERSTLMSDVGARNIDQYQQRTGKALPFVVVCIDEVALLSKEKQAHECLDEIGAIGRSLGVFLVLSQQRADAEIIGGRLKNNLNVRIAYRMSDALNSRMFLESDAAAGLTTPGRAIVKEPDRVSEVQTPWLDEEEADMIIERLRPTNDTTAATAAGVPIKLYDDDIIFGELIE